MKQLCLLGATGSIGRSTLDLLARHASEFALYSVAAQRDDATLAQICEQFRPETAVLAEPAAAQRLRERLRTLGVSTRVEDGPAAIEALAADPKVDIVVAAIVGAAGLAPTLSAAHAGKRILLANKEALVCAGAVLMQAVQSGGAQLLPIDSEHNAIFQSLDSHERPPRGVRRLWLTASGGPFRGWNQARLADVTVEMACAHPNWSMGPKISVDSATLMNKGLEVIEAHFLFGVPTADIRVLLHPQSTVHSLVEYVDGSFLAQLGSADMRIPIAHALAWPRRIESGAPCLDLAALGRLDFSEPDYTAFPCLSLAYTALERGGTAPAILNAANEVAVAAFLNGSMGFLDIAITVNDTLNRVPLSSAQTLAAVLAADAEARAVAQGRIDARKRS